MPEAAISDYFYGDEAEQFIYFRIPRQLITDPRFKHLSTDAKLLYGMLLDRMSLSVKNGWYDEDGRVYIYYTVEEICGDMNCGRDILQNISQLKELFKESWEGIIGNADAFIYLGGNEKETHKYISELLGKETIETRTSSQSRGRNGSYSQNFQQAGRDMPYLLMKSSAALNLT